jgi:hypothetical protein
MTSKKTEALSEETNQSRNLWPALLRLNIQSLNPNLSGLSRREIMRW